MIAVAIVMVDQTSVRTGPVSGPMTARLRGGEWHSHRLFADKPMLKEPREVLSHV
jgi:hypothetical protein